MKYFHFYSGSLITNLFMQFSAALFKKSISAMYFERLLVVVHVGRDVKRTSTCTVFNQKQK
jgi:hypothetical protein